MHDIQIMLMNDAHPLHLRHLKVCLESIKLKLNFQLISSRNMYQNWLKQLVLLLQQVVSEQKLHILLYNVDHVEMLFQILKLNLV